MASVYSDAYWTGDYTYTRVRVDYDGTWATAHLLYSRTNNWSGATYIEGATFVFNGASTGLNATRYGYQSDSEVAAVGFGISLNGGWYSGYTGGYDSGGYFRFSGGVSIPAQYSSPAVPSASNLTSDGVSHRAHSRVSSNGWGTNSWRRNFEVICNGGIAASDWNNDPGDMYWSLPNGSNNQNAGAINTWYGRAVNNPNVWWTDSGAKYIVTPSAPRYTISSGSGKNPKVSLSSVNVRYKGGESNSSSANSATLKRWSFALMTSDQSGVPSVFQSDQWTSSNSVSFDWSYGHFSVGKNYKFYIRAINHLGGTSSSTTNVFYCPTGVAGNMSSHTTTSITLRASYNYAGSYNSATSGTMSCYQFFWGDSADNLNHSSSIQTGTTYTVSNLVPAQTIYFKVKAWNVYGLNNVSNVTSAMTIPRYDPVVGEITATPKTPGGDITVSIDHTGGVTIDDETVTGVKLSWKPVSASSWTTLKNVTGLSLGPGDTYTFENAWTADAPAEGDYNIKVTITNGTEVVDEIFTLPAPSQVRLTGVTSVPDHPVQIQATATPTTSIAPYKYKFTTTGGAGTRVRVFESSASSYFVTSPNYLLFDTTYNVTATVYNAYGFWKNSSTVSVTTEPRAAWRYLSASGSKKAALSFLKTQGDGESAIKEVYYVVANALGNASVGDDLSGKKLKFITQPLHYRPESVASITFTNGKKIAYDYDEENDDYRFGIWDGDTIETLFFDDEVWYMDNYVIPAEYEVASIEHTGFGLNSSAPFSTTACVDVRPWEDN